MFLKIFPVLILLLLSCSNYVSLLVYENKEEGVPYSSKLSEKKIFIFNGESEKIYQLDFESKAFKPSIKFLNQGVTILKQNDKVKFETILKAKNATSINFQIEPKDSKTQPKEDAFSVVVYLPDPDTIKQFQKETDGEPAGSDTASPTPTATPTATATAASAVPTKPGKK